MKNIKYILFAFIATLVFTSCELTDDSDISGHDITESPVIYGWDYPTVTESYFVDEGVIEKGYPVKIIGGSDGQPFNKDITYTVSVVEDETTATNEYEIVNNTGVIKAGEDFGMFNILINTDEFSRTEATKVVLEMTGSVDGAVISSSSKKFELNFVGCLSDLDDTYADGDMYTSTAASMNLTRFNNVFYHYPKMSYFFSDYWFEFQEICGEITITKWQWSDAGYTIKQNKPAYVDTNGNIVFPSVTIENAGFDNLPVTLIKN